MVPSSKEEMPMFQDGNHRKETFALATVIVVLLIMSIATTITLLVIIYRLRLIPGLEFFTIIDDNVILHKNTYIDRILLTKSRISGLNTITGNILLESGRSSLRLDQDSIRLKSKHGLEIRSATTGKLLFPFDMSSLPLDSIKTLSVPNGIRDVKLIRSPLDDDLTIHSNGFIRIRGNQGIRLEGKRVMMEAKSIFLSSINDSIVLDGHKGIYLNMDSFRKRIVGGHGQQPSPLSSSSSSSSATTTTEEENLQYKLCICGKNGRLFRMAIKDSSSSCADARFPESDNPCL